MRAALVDTHCHLDFTSFDTDRDEVLQRASKAGVERIVSPSIDYSSCLEVIKLAGRFPQVRAAVGYHPNDLKCWTEEQTRCLSELALKPEVVAIGEIGLDYYRDHTPHDIQVKAFAAQLNVAAKAGLPVIVHNREASQELLTMLGKWIEELARDGSSLVNRPGILHSFSGSLEEARLAVELSFLIGISGPVTFKNARSLQEIVERLPLESLVVETDAPFLTPHPFRGKRNEPAYVVYVAEKIAQIKGVSVEQVAKITTANAARLFKWSEVH